MSAARLADLRQAYPGAELAEFGDGPELCAQLVALIVAGDKTATCGALRDYEAEGEPLPKVGRRDIVVDWEGTPVAVIETTEVTQRAFRDVPEAFALAEGEGDFDEWRRGHIAYFERNGGWSEDMVLVCERFRLVEILE